jgi:hypothetical protein
MNLMAGELVVMNRYEYWLYDVGWNIYMHG